jgi:predicted Rossmann fold flavoprotein
MKEPFDLIIIGGGAAGIMAALSAKVHHPEYNVAIFDRTFALGRKILVCGAGRCNVTNINLNSSAESRYYGADTSFIKPIFEQFSYERIVDFFKDLGVELYVERKTQIGKLFPVTDQAKTINTLLEDELKRRGVEIFLNTECKKLEKKNGYFDIIIQELENNVPKGNEKKLSSKYLILSAGGKTYPALGSNGSGYNLGNSLGHNRRCPFCCASCWQESDIPRS